MIESAINERAARAIRERVFPGCVVGVVHSAGYRLVIPSGHLTYEPGSAEVTAQTVYDLASVTKSVATASLALSLIAERKLALADRISRYIPELRNDQGATIEDLLRYRVHGVHLSKLKLRTFEEIRTHALEHGFDALPGDSIYTNLPAFFLGMAIERVGNASLAELAHRYLFAPLSMEATTYFPSPSDCAPTEIDDRGEVRGLAHDESTYVFARAGHTIGHAGLFSTAPDLLTFLESLLSGRNDDIAEGAQAGLGWQTKGAFLGAHASVGSYGKTGFTGTSVCIDPVKGLAFVILSNRTYPTRPVDNVAINAFRSDIADILLGV